MLSGGTVDGSTKINGGELILDAGAVFEPHAKLTIINTGELVLEQNTFKGTIKDFGGQDFMDLQKINSLARGQGKRPRPLRTAGASGCPGKSRRRPSLGRHLHHRELRAAKRRGTGLR